MKKARIIKNGNVNLENLQGGENFYKESNQILHVRKGLPSEVNDLIRLTRAKVDPISFAMAFYLWAKDNVHPVPTGNGYRLKVEDFKVKHDLRSVIKYFEEKVY